MEIDALATIVGLAVLVIGPGSGVWVGMRASLKELREDNRETARLLTQINDHLSRLNSRVGKSEAHIAGLEKREEREQ